MKPGDLIGFNDNHGFAPGMDEFPPRRYTNIASHEVGIVIEVDNQMGIRVMTSRGPLWFWNFDLRELK